ncbi:MAG: ankyrin repeat domain-containing protein [Spirochaetaceae bacterium]|nr:ankyrin repeat domain-containing protein [Spirochaetaceae bacterium]
MIVKGFCFTAVLHIFLAVSCAAAQDIQDIWTAAREGNARLIQSFVRNGADPNAVESGTGMSALAIAIARNDAGMVRALINVGADVEKESYSDYIHINIQNAEEMPDVVQTFLGAGAQIDFSKNSYHLFLTLDRTENNAAFFDSLLALKSDNESPALTNVTVRERPEDFNYALYHNYRLYRLHSPLKQAIYRQNVEIAQLLLEAAKNKAAMVNRRYTYLPPGRHDDEPEYAAHSPLTFAIRSGNREMVKLLLDAGAWTGEKAETWVYLWYGPLEYAISMKDAAIVQLMLECGVDPNESSHLSSDSLFYAVTIGTPEIVRLLIEAGADTDPENRYGDYQPLPAAVDLQNHEAARMLIEAGAVVNRPMDFYDTLLSRAVKKNDEAMVKLLLEGGADINDSRHPGYYRGHTPLTRAITDGNMDMVRLLLDAGADINSPGEYGNGPLQEAIKKGNTALTMEFLALGARVNTPDGTPPLFFAVQDGNIPLMRTLLDAGADIRTERENSTALSRATRVKDLETFKEILAILRERGLNDIDFHGEGAWTALQAAAQYGNFEAAKILLEEGADVNAGSAGGYTPLYNAIGPEENLALVELLINAGADLTALGPEQTIYLDRSWYMTGRFSYLVMGGAKDIELLLKAGADTEVRDSEGRTALMLYSFFDAPEIVRLLLDAGADPDARNNYGESALMFAVCNWGPASTVKNLLQAGANINAQSNTGDTALMFAIHYGPEGITQLIEAGADTSLQNNGGATALMIHMHGDDYWRYNEKDAAEETAVLLEKALAGDEQSRAALNLKDKDGWTALMYAAANTFIPAEVLELLISAGADVNAESSEGVTALMLLKVMYTIAVSNEYTYWILRHAKKIAVLKNAGAVEKPPLISEIPQRRLYSEFHGTEGMYQSDR